MAVTADLCMQRPNRQRWRLTQDGQAGTTVVFTTTGQATNDILTEAPPGAIRQIAKAFTNGYGAFAPGALIQSQARTLWLSNRTSLAPSVGSTESVMTARCKATPRTGTTDPVWTIDADVDGTGHPTITVTAPAAASVAYFDVLLEGGAIGA